jgi:hypothetical protein
MQSPFKVLLQLISSYCLSLPQNPPTQSPISQNTFYSIDLMGQSPMEILLHLPLLTNFD